MRIRIQILDPHWKIMDQNLEPGHFLRFTDFFLRGRIFKFDEPFRNQEMFIISLFSIVKIRVLIFFCVFSWYFARIRIQETKILRIQRIRILRAAYYLTFHFIHISPFIFPSVISTSSARRRPCNKKKIDFG